MADDYILAARIKIASATRQLAALNKVRAGDESDAEVRSRSGSVWRMQRINER